MNEVERAVESIRAGEVVGLPTDTVYGIGVDPLNDDAVERLFDLKGRPKHKPVGLLVADIEQASMVGNLSGKARRLAADNWPGALTLIVTPSVVLAEWVGDAQRRTVGIRVPDHPVAIDLLRRTGPLAVTSANLSGSGEAADDVEARSVFGDRVAVYVPGSSPGGVPSTVVDATTEQLQVLREGPVTV